MVKLVDTGDLRENLSPLVEKFAVKPVKFGETPD